ncbi:hypothetical protein ACTXT7_003724 [Hymenolepis weldensis]
MTFKRKQSCVDKKLKFKHEQEKMWAAAFQLNGKFYQFYIPSRYPVIASFDRPNPTYAEIAIAEYQLSSFTQLSGNDSAFCPCNPEYISANA